MLAFPSCLLPTGEPKYHPPPSPLTHTHTPQTSSHLVAESLVTLTGSAANRAPAVTHLKTENKYVYAPQMFLLVPERSSWVSAEADAETQIPKRGKKTWMIQKEKQKHQRSFQSLEKKNASGGYVCRFTFTPSNQGVALSTLLVKLCHAVT